MVTWQHFPLPVPLLFHPRERGRSSFDTPEVCQCIWRSPDKFPAVLSTWGSGGRGQCESWSCFSSTAALFWTSLCRVRCCARNWQICWKIRWSRHCPIPEHSYLQRDKTTIEINTQEAAVMEIPIPMAIFFFQKVVRDTLKIVPN